MTSSGATRRQVLAGTAAAALVGGLAACTRGGSRLEPADPSATPAPGALVALDAVAVGGSTVVRPEAGGHVVVARPTQDEVVAFSGVCTHAGCTVVAEDAQLVCPCHGSVFEAATGQVRSGPAPTALAPVPVEVRDGQVYPR